MPSSGLQGHHAHTHTHCTNIQANTHTHKKKKVITEYILLKMAVMTSARAFIFVPHGTDMELNTLSKSTVSSHFQNLFINNYS